ncbi:hypothetical protein ACQ7HM_21180 [Williamsia sp. MIQD14]|uniref:hypothetical protein n=1 Tax=Williamsia sp. MIQD14 TaxID=3425703 RepID=UPI003DA17B14
MGFEDELNRQLAARKVADAQSAQESVARSRRGERAADQLEAGLRQLAEHLGRQSPPRPYKIRPRRNWRTPAVMSPPGFPLQADWSRLHSGPNPSSLSSLDMLLPDGRVWRYIQHSPPRQEDIRGKLTAHGSVSIAGTSFYADSVSGDLYAEEWDNSGETNVRVSADKVLASWAMSFRERGVATGSRLPIIG